jgi:hypothetical protein
VKLWDVWLYGEEDLALPLAPPDEAQLSPFEGETAEAVVAQVIEAELMATLEGMDPIRWAVAVRETGSGQPFRLLQGTAALVFSVALGPISEAVADWET